MLQPCQHTKQVHLYHLLWLVGLWLCSATFPLSAQNYHLVHYDTNSGLPHQQVRHIAKDTFGFLWLATDAGLLRFDGQNFTDYAQQMPSRYIRHIASDGQGGLYISHDAGISYTQPSVDTALIELVYPGSIDSTSSALYYPQQMMPTSDGYWWIAQANGALRRISPDGKQKDFPLTTAHSPVNLFMVLYQDQLWVAIQNGDLYRIDNGTPMLIGNYGPIRAITSFEDELWLGSDRLQMLQWHTSKAMLRLQRTIPLPPGAELSAMAIGQDGQMMIGVLQQGLFLIDRNSSTPSFIKVFANNDPHRIDELPFRQVHNIVAQAQQEWWIASAEGMGILRKRFFETVSGLPNGNTTAITATKQGDVVVNFGDVFRVMTNAATYQAEPFPSFDQGTIATLTAAQSGNQLWAGTTNGQLLRLRANGDLLASFDFGERGEGIFFALQDQQKRVWFCQAPAEQPIKGVAYLSPEGQLHTYGPEKGLDDRILVVRETPQGRIYAGGIGAATYLYRYLPEEDAFVNLSLPFDFYVSPNFEVHDLAVDQEGIVWLATTDGLLRYDLDRIRQINLGPDLTNSEVRSVACLSDGSVWLATDTKGLLRYHSGEILPVGEESGLPSKVMSYRAIVVDAQERLWIGTAEGMIYSLRPKPQPQLSTAPWLRSVKVGKEYYKQIETLITKIGEPSHWSVSSPSYHGYRTFYQYRISESDGWSAPSTEQHFTIPALPAGNHTLSIRARQEGSYAWSPAQQYAMVIEYYWYQEAWFQWALLLSGLLLVMFWYRWRRRRYHHRIDDLQEELTATQQRIQQQAEDLTEVQDQLREEQVQEAELVECISTIRRIAAQLDTDNKWDDLLHVLSNALVTWPGLRGFTVIHKRGRQNIADHFDLQSKQWHKWSMQSAPTEGTKAQVYQTLQLSKPVWPKHLTFASGTSCPLLLAGSTAQLWLLSTSPQRYNANHLEAARLLGIYLEQISQD